MSLTPSPTCLAVIKQFEGCKLAAYLCPARVWTIGWGATGPGIGQGVRWTQAQADQRLAADVSRFAAGVAAAIGTVATTQGQFDAMVSFAYNLGLGAFRESTLLRRHRDGNHGAVAAEFAKWNHAGGRVLDGLTRRRAAEAALYRH